MMNSAILGYISRVELYFVSSLSNCSRPSQESWTEELSSWQFQGVSFHFMWMDSRLF